MIETTPAAIGLSGAVAPILRALPQWFGIESATQMYIRAADELPTVLAVEAERASSPIGFLTMMHHSAAAAEIYVIGVLPQYHRQGVGRMLVEAAELDLRARGVTFLQVKTLSDKHPDPGYRKTRAFYHAMGFRLLEEFPDLWGSDHPCWQMVKVVGDY